MGNSHDWRAAKTTGIIGLLNVAHDLGCSGAAPGLEYMQVGLIDGPGNPQGVYYSAVLALGVLLGRHKRVLVYCHDGKSRSVAVAVAYLNTLVRQRNWHAWFDIMYERTGVRLPQMNVAHCDALDNMNWQLLADTIGEL